MNAYESDAARTRIETEGQRIQGRLTKVKVIRDTKKDLGTNPALLVLAVTLGIIAAMYLANIVVSLFAAI